jgi:hypothetical protein
MNDATVSQFPNEYKSEMYLCTVESITAILKHFKDPVLMTEDQPFIYEYDLAENIAHITSVLAIVEREYATVLMLQHGCVKIEEIDLRHEELRVAVGDQMTLTLVMGVSGCDNIKRSYFTE